MTKVTANRINTTVCDGESSEKAACFHCGQRCRDDSFARNEKLFCCNGCLVVHDLLTETGLGHYYDLRRNPGARIQKTTPSEQWAYLDELALLQRLLDFTDGKQSKVTFHVPAIHCIACVWLLENLFRLHPAVGRSQVNFARREVAITFATRKLKLSELVALLASIGYEPTLTFDELDKPKGGPARKRAWLQVGIAGFAFGNIMLFSIPQYFGLNSFNGGNFKTLFGWASLALALPVVIFSASDYWKSALLSLRQRVLTLDVPIALGLAAIYGESAYEIITRTGEGYCDSLTGLIFFLLCGRMFQAKTYERMAFDRDYKSFFPLSVTRRSQNKTEERVPLSQLQIGDRIIIRNGELVPADAKLISGPAFIDYSFVTGESEPVARSEGDHLYAGGQQIGSAIEIETLKAVSQSYLTSLWNHETFRKNRNQDFNTLTNRYSRRFTLIVISIAVAVAAFWIASGNLPRGVKAFTSVLIVACPCALALAAPFTLGTAQRWLAQISVFLKNALVLERLALVDAIVFDKTGTLTSTGAKAVKFEGAELNEAERTCIFSLTRHSTHPHSVRISESFGSRLFPEPVRSFLETPGCGIEGQVNGREIWLGSRVWLESRGALGSSQRKEALTSTYQDIKSEPPHVGCYEGSGSVVHVAIDGRHRGAFVLSSSLRPEADQLIRRLAGRYELALLSGDNERERACFLELFGNDAKLNFNQSPLDKLGFIRRLQECGKTVMMVGDGLNDAGALKQADVGVAVVEKIGAFSPASDVILDAGHVPQLFEILTLARRSAWIVRISFGISSLYNIVGVSIAAAGLLSPLTCAVLMPLSSASVVLFACGVTTWAARRSGLLADRVVSDNSEQTLTPSLSLSERERENHSANVGEFRALGGRSIPEAVS
ncbi:MAG: heavy metal translocating P-type ATPase metal-binding domain-containing protein [Verrucomicrobia bacterium]|nr:heavy metal translocating P-type ATPase metal-binding domain-containing protein [Verrucomicrobiota bacterium]